MLIEEITESNYKEKNEEGIKRVDLKIKKLERQIEIANKEQGDPLVKDASIDWYLFLDPTIWAYKFLKDKKGNPLKLRPFQDRIINDKHQEVIVAASNQIGKTVTAEVKALHHAIHVDNASVLIISKSESQSIFVLDQIKQLMLSANISFKEVIGEVENRMELHIKNLDGKGISVIRCLPPTTRVLGYYATLIICDEIGFWEIENMKQSEYYNRVIYSRTLDTQNWENDFFTMGQIFCISNPNAEQGALWALWNNKRCHTYRSCFLANPENTIEKYNMYKNDPEIAQDEFDSVYAAVFSSASGGFITLSEYKDATKEEYELRVPLTNSVFFGADFAGEDTTSRDVDSTVLIGATPVKIEKVDKVQICYAREFPLRSKKSIVYDELKKYNVSKFAYDKAGVGDSVKFDLKEKGILPEYKVEALTYSLPNKTDVYVNMKRLFENRLIMIPDVSKLKEQLLGLRFEKTEGGHLKIHHAREGLHDDWADALANACFAAKRLMGVVPSFKGLKDKKKENEVSSKKYLLVCPGCELEGKDGYYKGINKNNKYLERIPCPEHA